MSLQWIGAILVIAGCGGVGFLMAMYDKRELDALCQLHSVLEYMICELGYRMTPLPELCRKAAARCKGSIRCVMEILAGELESQIAPDVGCCVTAAVSKVPELPSLSAELIRQLGFTLGIFDLQGQIRGLEAVRDSCVNVKRSREANRIQRIRSYQTLGLCAGAAIAILFL